MTKMILAALGPRRFIQMITALRRASLLRWEAGVKDARLFPHSLADVEQVCGCLEELVELVVTCGLTTKEALQRQEAGLLAVLVDLYKEIFGENGAVAGPAVPVWDPDANHNLPVAINQPAWRLHLGTIFEVRATSNHIHCL